MESKALLRNVIGVVSIASFLMLGGCSVSDMKEAVGNGNATRTANVKLKPIYASDVKIYSRTPKHYKVIGRVAADNYGLVGIEHSQKTIMTELKKQAASIGANGVLHIHAGLAQTTAEAVLLQSK